MYIIYVRHVNILLVFNAKFFRPHPNDFTWMVPGTVDPLED